MQLTSTICWPGKLTDGRLEVTTGQTPDIAAFLEVTFWQKVLYQAYDESFPDSHELPGRFLGMSENCGYTLTLYILTENNKII